MKKLPLLGLLMTALLFTACTHDGKKHDTDDMPPAPKDGGEIMEKNDDDMMIPDEDKMMDGEMKDGDKTMNDEEPMMDRAFQNRILMTNVSELPNATGEGWYGVIDGETRLITNFLIDAPSKEYFYEGWLVCNGVPFSTGALDMFEGLYENYFASATIPEVCEQYVLTLEPRDDDPAPADHVMEGTMEGIAHADTASPDWDDEHFEEMSSFGPELYGCADGHEFTLTGAVGDVDTVYYVPSTSGVSTTLTRMEAASGEKYSNADGAIIVWTKEFEAMVMNREEVVHGECSPA